MDEKSSSVNEWINSANRDLHTAEIIYKNAEGYIDMIGFHCQQAVEKYLKAYLIYLEIDFPKTHNLTLLIDLIDEKIPFADEFYERANQLKSFAIEIRYPLGRIDLSTIDIMEKIKIANEFKEEIVKRSSIR